MSSPTYAPGEPPDPVKRLIEYASTYMSKFNSLRGELLRSGTPAALYGEEITRADILLGNDGIIILYLTEKTRKQAGVPPGVQVEDWTDQSLCTITQKVTANGIKIDKAQPGDNVLMLSAIPEDFPQAEILCGLAPEFLEPFAQKGTGAEVTGMVVGPQWRVENNTRVAILPTRGRVFSPFRPIPPAGHLTLELLFPFVDLIWKHEELHLNAEAGIMFASADVEVLMLGMRAGISAKQLAESPFESVAAHCERQCDEFFKLIDDSDTAEEAVQDFLEKPENQFLVSPHARAVFPHKRLGGNRFIPDFVVHRPDDDYHFIEIESPNSQIYQAKGEEPTAAFTHAIVQVEDWLRYIDQNLLTVRNEDNMPTLYKPTGEVVIGRKKHLGENARIRFQYKRAESHRIEYKTYDMMAEAGRAYAASVRRLMGSPR